MADIVYIGLGSNLNDPIKQVAKALDALASLSQTTLLKRSSSYWSESLLPGQPRYCNAVAMLKTELTPLQLLTALQTIEQAHGRIKNEKWGARVIDLDILLYGKRMITSQLLTIPHLELLNRNFWLYPLAEIAPDAYLAHISSSIRELKIDPTGLELIA